MPCPIHSPATQMCSLYTAKVRSVGSIPRQAHTARLWPTARCRIGGSGGAWRALRRRPRVEGGHRQFDKARVGMRRWLKLVLGGGGQHQQRQHGRLTLGGMVAGQGRVEPTTRGSRDVLVARVPVRSRHRHVPPGHARHRRHSAGAQQEAVIGAGKGRKHRQPNHHRCRNQAAGEITCCSPYQCALMFAMHRNLTELPQALDRLSSTSGDKIVCEVRTIHKWSKCARCGSHFSKPWVERFSLHVNQWP